MPVGGGTSTYLYMRPLSYVSSGTMTVVISKEAVKKTPGEATNISKCCLHAINPVTFIVTATKNKLQFGNFNSFHRKLFLVYTIRVGPPVFDGF